MNSKFAIESGISDLFKPISINTMVLKNRFIMPGMQRSWCIDGAPTERMARYYQRRIRGGVPLIISESCAVAHPTSTAQPLACRIDLNTASAWSSCIGSVRDTGGHFLIQLWHEGALRSDADHHVISASGLGFPGFARGRAATTQDLSEIVEAYAQSARIAQLVGADGVELHCAHGFFLDQFLWSATNRREDEFGGETLAERATLHAKIIQAVRQACGAEFVISIRFSQWKEKDYEARIAHTPEELKGFLDLLSRAGADVFHASARRFWEPEWPGSDKTIAGWTRHLSGMPTIAVGSACLDRDVMESFESEGEANGTVPETITRMRQGLQAGHFDMLAVGRGLISDPDLVSKLADGDIWNIRAFRKSDIADFEWDD